MNPRAMLCVGLMSTGLVLSCGCRAVAPGLESAIVCVASSEIYRTNAHWPEMCHIIKVDGDDDLGGALVKLPPGPHRITASVVWSNYFGEEVTLPVVLPAGGYCDLFALAVPRDLGEPFSVRRMTFSEEMKHSLAAGAAQGAAPLIAPLFFGKLITTIANPPQGRPPSDRCHVWIQDRRTGEVMAGDAPRH